MTVIHHTHNDCSCMSRRLIPLIVAIVASREIYTASALCISRAGGVALLSSHRQSPTSTGGARRRRSSSSLDYRSYADDINDGLDRYYNIDVVSIYNEQQEINNSNDDDELDQDQNDPLSRVLTRRNVHRHDHFPDAIQNLLSAIPFPQLPPSWVVTSEVMEGLVGGAGGAGVFLHMHNAGEVFGLPLRRRTVMTQNNDDDVDMHTRHASSATAAVTTKARKEVVDTAKASYPLPWSLKLWTHSRGISTRRNMLLVNPINCDHASRLAEMW